MFEQLTQLVQQFGQDAVVKNNAIPNEHNEAVMQETGSTILSGLKDVMGQSGGLEQLGGLLGGGSVDESNPVVGNIKNQLVNNLGSKFGIDEGAASGLASSMIPKVLSSLVGNANDPNQPGFQMSDIVNAISGGGASGGGLMDMVSKYGGSLGLDQNADGKVDASDAMAAISKNSGGLGGLLGKLFGK
jgi:hypothetical protein